MTMNDDDVREWLPKSAQEVWRWAEYWHYNSVVMLCYRLADTLRDLSWERAARKAEREQTEELAYKLDKARNIAKTLEGIEAERDALKVELEELKADRNDECRECQEMMYE